MTNIVFTTEHKGFSLSHSPLKLEKGVRVCVKDLFFVISVEDFFLLSQLIEKHEKALTPLTIQEGVPVHWDHVSSHVDLKTAVIAFVCNLHLTQPQLNLLQEYLRSYLCNKSWAQKKTLTTLIGSIVAKENPNRSDIVGWVETAVKLGIDPF